MAITTVSVGDRVMRNNDGASTRIPEGTMGLVEVVENLGSGYETEAYVRWDNGRAGWLYISRLDSADPALITDLDAYKRLVTRKVFEAKIQNSWCGVAENLCARFGLREYMPSNRTAQIDARVPVQVWPGESDETVLARVRAQISGTEGVPGLYFHDNTLSEAQDAYSDVPDETPEGEDIDAFRKRLAKVATTEGRRHSVSGIDAFLTSVGIDPDTVPAYVIVSAEVSVAIEVPTEVTDQTEYARGLLDLMIANSGAEGVSVAGVYTR